MISPLSAGTHALQSSQPRFRIGTRASGTDGVDSAASPIEAVAAGKTAETPALARGQTTGTNPRRDLPMTTLAPTLEAYFTDRLLCQQRVSPNTVASYRDAFRLLLAFVEKNTGTPPSKLALTQLDAPTIGAFLEHLEHERHNTRRTRNMSPRRDPLVLPVLRAAPPRALRADCPRARDPTETRQEANGHVPHPRGGPGAARRSGPDDVGRTTRSRAPAHRRPDRLTGVRGARTNSRRHPARHRRARPDLGGGTEGESRAAHHPDRGRAQGVDARMRR